MMCIKFINLMCVVIYTSHHLGTTSSISLVSGPEDALVLVGTDVILKCEVIIDGANEISWGKTKDGLFEYIYPNERFSIVPDSYNLNISNALPSDSGVYECFYSINGTYKHFDPIRANATLIVQQPPTINCSLIRNDIRVILKKQYFHVGDSIKFQCSATERHAILNITKSGVDVPEYETEYVFGQQQVESRELIQQNDTEFRCYLESEELAKPIVCKIELIAVSVSPNSKQGISIMLPLIIAPIAAVTVLSAAFLLYYCRNKRKHSTRHNSTTPIYENTINPTESTGQHLHECESEDTIYLETVVMPSDSNSFSQNQEDNIDELASIHYDIPKTGSSQAIVYANLT